MQAHRSPFFLTFFSFVSDFSISRQRGSAYKVKGARVCTYKKSTQRGKWTGMKHKEKKEVENLADKTVVVIEQVCLRRGLKSPSF